ncbi:LppX_LprAFG lipoprotein [Nocardioides yefusunii]|uniref:LppX_LprAFG lipoprotein n=1 Tax=Nocardioides yefusunii TaxID=2500546 RepID=A0ABW1QUL7_9ACTN|nr:LppX_LprAFG lipoprotein [Nocardioides yefusunii]
MRTTTWTAVAGFVLTAPWLLSGCSGDDAAPTGSPLDVLAAAATELDSTSGAHLTLTSTDFPSGAAGVMGAEGDVVTETGGGAGFEGDLTVNFAGAAVPVPVRSLDGTVWAQIPLTQGWSVIDPAEYGAPDPSGLLSRESGVAALLNATEDVEAGSSVRGGKNNAEVLTPYTGTISGDVMQRVLPTSAGDEFDVTFRITSAGTLAEAEMTGVFYPDTPEMTYTLVVSDLGLERVIEAP